MPEGRPVHRSAPHLRHARPHLCTRTRGPARSPLPASPVGSRTIETGSSTLTCDDPEGRPWRSECAGAVATNRRHKDLWGTSANPPTTWPFSALSLPSAATNGSSNSPCRTPYREVWASRLAESGPHGLALGVSARTPQSSQSSWMMRMARPDSPLSEVAGMRTRSGWLCRAPRPAGSAGSGCGAAGSRGHPGFRPGRRCRRVP